MTALDGAGFETAEPNDRSGFAFDFFQVMSAKAKSAGGPAPLGLHTLMRESTAAKVKNMIDNLGRGLIAPVELIARRR